jgi:membrane protein required for colicin V production
MQVYDLVMLIVLVASVLFGAIKGFAWQLAALSSILVSYFVAYRFRYAVAEHIDAQPPWNLFLAMLLLYVASSLVIWVGFRLVSRTIDRVRLREFDRHLGAVFGGLKGIIYCLLLTMFAMSLLGPQQQAAIVHSRSGFYISKILAAAGGLLPREIDQIVGPHLARLEEQLRGGQEAGQSAGEGGGPWPGETPPAGWPSGGSGSGLGGGASGGDGWPSSSAGGSRSSFQPAGSESLGGEPAGLRPATGSRPSDPFEGRSGGESFGRDPYSGQLRRSPSRG